MTIICLAKTLSTRCANFRSALFQKITGDGQITKSAHPARFSPDDKYSRHRVTLKKRYNILLTQLPAKAL